MLPYTRYKYKVIRFVYFIFLQQYTIYYSLTYPFLNIILNNNKINNNVFKIDCFFKKLV